MISTGEYRENNLKSYNIAIEHSSNPNKALVVLWKDNEIISAYRKDSMSEKCARSKLAKKVWDTMLSAGLKKCSPKNGFPQPFIMGTSMLYSYETGKKNVKTGSLELFNKELVACQIEDVSYDKDGAVTEQSIVVTQYNSREDMRQWLAQVEANEKFIGLVSASDVSGVKGADNILVKTVEEIALEKESVEWLKNKKYYIVNDDLEAEKLFQFLENYNKMIAYDVESTGLRINKFGKIGSEDAKILKKYNEENPDKQLRVDKLVGIIFCVEEDVSYYFPVANKKFKNLYESGSIRDSLIVNIKARYTIGDKRHLTNDIARHIRETPAEELTSDVILMERVRDILEKKYIATHFGGYEQKVGYLYDMLLNIVDDSGILHQILHKFRGTTSNRGEPSNLKHLSKVDLGIDQWELKDFFPQYKELVGETNKVSPIDFSLMDYDGTRIYAPADGDCAFQLVKKYRKDLETEHKNKEYIYNVELIVLKAIAYTEFYGIRYDENKIEEKKNDAVERLLILESYMRQLIDFSSDNEVALCKRLDANNNRIGLLEQSGDKVGVIEAKRISKELVGLLRQEIDKSDKLFNPNSPAQVAEALYDILQYPAQIDSKSVDKKKIKALCGAYEEDNKQDKYDHIRKVFKNKENGTVPQYLGAHVYKEYKSLVTLLTKFFDKLPEFMYPGGFIFASFGQISTATGRMSCSKPNLQQMPKTITKIVIPRLGCVFIDADYSQIEYRVLAGMAQEPFLINQFENPDNDYHTLQAALMYGVPYEEVTSQMRSDAKSFNFGIPYGMGLGSLAILLVGINNAVTRAMAEDKKNLYFANQPLVEQLFCTIKEQAQMYNKTETLWHRTREYSFVRKDGTVNEGARAAALRQAGNATIQGCLGGDTRIQTKEVGIVKIKDVVNRHVHVWDGKDWTKGDITYSGKKRKCKVTFSNGQSIVCSPIHKFLVASHRGKTRFVECKDLLSKEMTVNPHRVKISEAYEKSDYQYNSNWAHKYDSLSSNARNVYVDDIGDSFKAGVVLGRLASDGSVLLREKGASSVIQYVAEHESNILPELKRYMSNLGVTERNCGLRKERNQEMTQLTVYSKSLTNEIDDLNIKREIHDRIFMDTEMLRGYLRGLFDGDGGISGSMISLNFGVHADFEEMFKDIQKALLFFGIRSRYYKYPDRHRINIKTNDNERFLDVIGFVNEEKQAKGRQLECIKDEKLFGKCLVVESVEMTDEYIDMYDVCNTDRGYYVADGVITHNTAADIFKIGLARVFLKLVEEDLLGKVFISNLVHDEQLLEVNYKELNVKKVVTTIDDCMCFDVDGLPPLFIGAGVSKSWYSAKSSNCEIHPNLMKQLKEETKNESLRGEGTFGSARECVEKFAQINEDYRRNKIIAYLVNPEHQNKKLHPVIGALLLLAFNKTGNEKATTEELLTPFIEENNLVGLTAQMFLTTVVEKEFEEDTDYEDDEDGEDGEDEFGGHEFTLIDESSNIYGMSIIEWIETFTLVASEELGIVGVDTRALKYGALAKLIAYLEQRVCEPEDQGAMQVAFLKGGRILERHPIYVRNIDCRELMSIGA